MKKQNLLSVICYLLFAAGAANAGYDDKQFRNEVTEGLDIHVARTNAYVQEDDAIGEMGMEVYQTRAESERNNYDMYIPNTMYVRAGAGMNLGFASGDAHDGDQKIGLSNGWGTQIGLGWNMSSYVRTEIDFQVEQFGFSGHDDADASARSVGGNLYFDFARRWVRTGDITKRRTFVPYMGLGAGVGAYKFEGANGANGLFVAPRGMLGFNVMMTDLIGVDLTYQYQLFIGDGFGWNTSGGVTGISDVIVSFRVNF